MRRRSASIYSKFSRSLCLSLCLCLSLPYSMPSAVSSTALASESTALFLREAEAGTLIPASFGTVQDVFKPEGAGKPAPAVVLLEDAHAVPGAQFGIEKIIHHLSERYDVFETAAEGTSGPFDALLFKTFPLKRTLDRVIDYYLEEGELPGAAAFAMRGPGETPVNGMEDMRLYEEDINAYLRAGAQRERLNDELQKIRRQLDAFKKEHYPPELLELDRALEAFRGGADNLAGLAAFMAQTGQAHGMALREDYYPDLSALAKLADAETEVPPAVTHEIEVLAEQAKAGLDHFSGTVEFNAKLQAYQTEQLSPEDFLEYLLSAAKANQITLKLSPALKERLEIHRKANAIEGERLFEELESYAAYLKKTLISTPAQAEAEKLTRALYLLTGLRDFKLSRSEWNELRLLSEKSGAPAEHPHDRLAAAAEGVSSLLESRHVDAEPFYHFYRTAEKREASFFEHILSAGADVQGVSILVAGGFHTQGLAEILRRENVPHVVVTPAISNLPENNRYDSHMKGEISWDRYFTEENGRISVMNAFTREAAGRLLSAAREAAGEQGVPIVLKKWRENLVEALVAERRLSELPQYVRVLNDVYEGLSPVGGEEKARAAWLRKVESFAAGLKGLEAGRSFSEEKIAGLFRAPAAAAWSTSMVLTRNTAPAGWRRGKPDFSGAGRSELRSVDEEIDARELQAEMELAIRSLEAAYDNPDLPSPKKNRKRIKDSSTRLSDTINLVTVENSDEEKKREILERARIDLRLALSLLKELKMPAANPVENAEPAVSVDGSGEEGSEYIERLLQSVINAKSYPLKMQALLQVRSAGTPNALSELQAIARDQRPVEERIAAILMLGVIGPSARETAAYLREIRRARTAARGKAAYEWYKLQIAAGWALDGILKSEGSPIPVHLLDPRRGGPEGEEPVILPFTPRHSEMSDVERLLSAVTKFTEEPQDQEEAVRSLASLGAQAVEEILRYAESHPFLQGRIGAILALGLMRENAADALAKLDEISRGAPGDPEKFGNIRAAAAWAAAQIRGAQKEPPPYPLLRSEMRAGGVPLAADPLEIRRQLFHGEILVFAEEIRGAILSLIPEPVLSELESRGTSPEQLAWKMNGQWIDVPDRNADWFVQVDRSPNEGILVISLVPVLPFYGGFLRDYAPVYLPLQDTGNGEMGLLVGGRLNPETLQADNEAYTRDSFSYWLKKNLDPFSRRFGFTSHRIQPLGVPISVLTAAGFEKQESGDFVRSVPSERPELRDRYPAGPDDVYDIVLRNLALSKAGPVNVESAVPAVLTLLRQEGSVTAAGRLIERAEEPVYFTLYTGAAEAAAVMKYTALEAVRRKNSGYDAAASAWAQSALASLPEHAEAYFARMKAQGAEDKELNYSFAFPTDGSPQVREWILQLLDTIREMQAHPEYGTRVRANIRVLVTRDELMDPLLKDFFKTVGRSPSAEVLEITSAASAAVQLRGFFERHQNALAYGVEDYPLDEKNALRLVRSDIDAERTFPVALLLARKLAEAPGITPELLRNMTAEISAMVGFDGRGLHISTLAYEIALEYTVDQFISQMA